MQFTYRNVLALIAYHTRFAVEDLVGYRADQLERLLQSVARDWRVSPEAKGMALEAVDNIDQWRGSCPTAGYQGEQSPGED